MQALNADQEVIYRFEGYELDPARRRLSKDGEAMQLTPKAFDTLLVLVRNRGRVITKDELMQAVWPDTIVEETNLAHNISTLRKLLGQKGGDNRFIITAPGRGYQFVAEVRQQARGAENLGSATEQADVALVTSRPETIAPPVANASPSQTSRQAPALLITKHHVSFRWRTALSVIIILGLVAVAGLIWRLQPAAGRPIRSLAVLPFKPLVADQGDEVLQMGIADTLISRLSSLKQVTVRPISAVRRYTSLDQDTASAGRELDVQAVLEGSIQKAGGKLRVTTRLINVVDGRMLWTRQFEDSSPDIFALQDAIAERVAGELAVTLTGEERGELVHNYTTDSEAYQLYLIGRYQWNKRTADGMQKSITAFEQAIARDPNYALAYVGLADAYATLGSYHLASTSDVLPKARAAADQALALDPNLAEAYAVRGKIFTDYDWDWPRADGEFQRALQLQPNCANAHHWYSTLLANEGRFDEAVREAQLALELDHHSPVVSTQLGAILYRARRYDQAIAALQKALDLEPNSVTAHLYLGLCDLMLKRPDDALAEFERSKKIAPDIPDPIAMAGFVNARMGNREAARQCLQDLEALSKKRYVSPSSMASVYRGLGEMDEAFKWMKKACDERDPYIRGLKIEPSYDDIREDPRYHDRYIALLRCAGLEP